jgi:hypothetical protein
LPFFPRTCTFVQTKITLASVFQSADYTFFGMVRRCARAASRFLYSAAHQSFASAFVTKRMESLVSVCARGEVIIFPSHTLARDHRESQIGLFCVRGGRVPTHSCLFCIWMGELKGPAAAHLTTTEREMRSGKM